MSTNNGSDRKPGRPLEPVSRQVFLSAARAEFAEHGFGGASMAGIARRAGVTKAAVFHHFGKKENIYVVVLSDICDEMGQLIRESLSLEGDILDRLDDLGEQIIRYLGAHPQAARLLVREMVDAGPFFEGPGKVLVEEVLDITTQLLESGITDSEDPHQDALQLSGSIVGLHLFWFAAVPVSSHLSEGDPFTNKAIERRIRAVQAHVRRLCGV